MQRQNPDLSDEEALNANGTNMPKNNPTSRGTIKEDEATEDDADDENQNDDNELEHDKNGNEETPMESDGDL